MVNIHLSLHLVTIVLDIIMDLQCLGSLHRSFYEYLQLQRIYLVLVHWIIDLGSQPIETH